MIKSTYERVNVNMKDKFREQVKSAADHLKESSVQKFLERDEEYKKDVNELNEVEQAYMEVYLSEKQRLICDKLFFCKDRVDYEYGINAYIAGLYDAFRLIELFGMEEIKR